MLPFKFPQRGFWFHLLFKNFQLNISSAVGQKNKSFCVLLWSLASLHVLNGFFVQFLEVLSESFVASFFSRGRYPGFKFLPVRDYVCAKAVDNHININEVFVD
jgi:hypothetical protein